MRVVLWAALAALFGVSTVALADDGAGAPKFTCEAPTSAEADITIRCTAPQLALEAKGRKAEEFWCWEPAIELASLRVMRPGAPAQDFKLHGRTCQSDFASGFDLTDLNFDGFDDLVMVTRLFGPNRYHVFWIYSPARGALVANERYHLTGSNVTAHPDTKTVSVNYHSGQQTWDTATFSWNDDVLELRSYELAATALHPAELPIPVSLNRPICGRELIHFNGDALITRIDLDFGAYEENYCTKEDRISQAELAQNLRLHARGCTIDMPDEKHITIVFDKPKAPQDLHAYWG